MGGVVQLPGQGAFDPNSAGKNGTQMKWPAHPGEYGVKGAEKQLRWKDEVQMVMWMKSIDKRIAAILTNMFAESHAKKMLERFQNHLVKYIFCELILKLNNHAA